jgi:hypothetical protein
MDDSARVQCPYCFEWVEVYVDPDSRGEMVQDCDVCCRPWHVHVDRDDDGTPVVFLSRAQ